MIAHPPCRESIQQFAHRLGQVVPDRNDSLLQLADTDVQFIRNISRQHPKILQCQFTFPQLMDDPVEERLGGNESIVRASLLDFRIDLFQDPFAFPDFRLKVGAFPHKSISFGFQPLDLRIECRQLCIELSNLITRLLQLLLFEPQLRGFIIVPVIVDGVELRHS